SFFNPSTIYVIYGIYLEKVNIDESHSFSSSPSHLYRILIACSGPWSQDGTSCLQPSDLMVLSFIFPHVDGDINCLAKEDLLLEYTARLLDVELISGLHLTFPNVPREQTLRLKTHINTKLW
ncbi:hypothetical protein OSTOST_07494, partial [Ostertagia ostertagi]